MRIRSAFIAAGLAIGTASVAAAPGAKKLAAAIESDLDRDGIPASWELQHGTSDSDPADAVLDFDGDGLPNFVEYLTAGAPWGRYETLRFPAGKIPGGVAAVEFVSASRSGRFLLHITTRDGRATHWLWTIPGAGPDEIPDATPSLSLPELPADWTGLEVIATAGQRAIAVAHNPAGEVRSLFFEDNRWSTLSDPAFPEPLLTAIDERGTVLGWECIPAPPRAILWKERAALLTTVVPEASADFVPCGLTGSGILYGADASGPVALRRLPDISGDDPSKAAATFTDRDGDGIDDRKEASAGLDPGRLDSDGDGWADLHQMLHGKAAVNSGTNHAGLAVFTPARHPFLSTR